MRDAHVVQRDRVGGDAEAVGVRVARLHDVEEVQPALVIRPPELHLLRGGPHLKAQRRAVEAEQRRRHPLIEQDDRLYHLALRERGPAHRQPPELDPRHARRGFRAAVHLVAGAARDRSVSQHGGVAGGGGPDGPGERVRRDAHAVRVHVLRPHRVGEAQDLVTAAVGHLPRHAAHGQRQARRPGERHLLVEGDLRPDDFAEAVGRVGGVGGSVGRRAGERYGFDISDAVADQHVERLRCRAAVVAGRHGDGGRAHGDARHRDRRAAHRDGGRVSGVGTRCVGVHRAGEGGRNIHVLRGANGHRDVGDGPGGRDRGRSLVGRPRAGGRPGAVAIGVHGLHLHFVLRIRLEVRNDKGESGGIGVGEGERTGRNVDAVLRPVTRDGGTPRVVRRRNGDIETRLALRRQRRLPRRQRRLRHIVHVDGDVDVGAVVVVAAVVGRRHRYRVAVLRLVVVVIAGFGGNLAVVGVERERGRVSSAEAVGDGLAGIGGRWRLPGRRWARRGFARSRRSRRCSGWQCRHR